jgi:cation transport regulator ChaC
MPEDYEVFLDHLKDAERSAQEALALLYKLDGDVKRGLAYRIRLGQAQNILMTLYVREINRNDSDAHEWEHLGANTYECVYCERKVKGRLIGRKTVFSPDLLRRIPKYGRRYRCRRA